MINWLMRYQVIDSADQVIATTRTKWTADLIINVMNKSSDVGLVPFKVVDHNGQPIPEEDEDE